MEGDTKKQQNVGVIAQEVERVLPEVVKRGDNNVRSVSYGNIVGLLIECIKDNRREIDRLKEELKGII